MPLPQFPDVYKRQYQSSLVLVYRKGHVISDCEQMCIRDRYKESVLPKAVRKRVAVEALSDFGWGRYVGLDGACVTMTGFGASGPAAQLFEHFGFTAEHVAEVARSL